MARNAKHGNPFTRLTPEQRRDFSRLTPEQRSEIGRLGGLASIAKHGHRGIKAAQLARWKGNDISYDGAHDRVHRLHGPASRHACTQCGQQAADWAYDHSDPHAKYGNPENQTVAYSPDPSRYRPMCKPCHATFDAERRAAPANSGTALEAGGRQGDETVPPRVATTVPPAQLTGVVASRA